jgi:squalene cyclase
VDGSWRYPDRSNHPTANANYYLLENYRSLRILVEMYGLHRSHPALAKAAEYIFSCQSNEGDIRGILGNQYMPYYHGAILELLIKSGYEKDSHTINGLEWLLSMRQADGGWASTYTTAWTVMALTES